MEGHIKETENQFVERITLAVSQKYSFGEADLHSTNFHYWTRIFTPEGIQEKKFLDIACGSTFHPDKSGDYRVERYWEPWLSRFLHEAGVPVVGVDIGNLEKEEFEHYELDLTNPDSLKRFVDSSFDAIQIGHLFDKPASPTLKVVDLEEFRNEMMRESLRILKDGGILAINLETYIKDDDVFVKTDGLTDCMKKYSELKGRKNAI